MQIDRDQLNAAAAALRAAWASDEPEHDITAPDGTPMRIVKHPEPGVRARIEVRRADAPPLVTTLWETSDDRPSAYPPELPFIANLSAATSTIDTDRGQRRQVQWFALADADTVADQIVEQSVRQGWQHTAVQPSTPFLSKMVTLVRPPEERTVIAAGSPQQGMVSVIDTRRERTSEAE